MYCQFGWAKGPDGCDMCKCKDVPSKPGFCPAVESDQLGSCQEECSNDDGCQGNQKCCSNGCGHVCTAPEYKGMLCRYLHIFSNYWMRLSRIWRILQIKEGVIRRGWKPRWITPSEICKILHILRKQNLIIGLLFIQNISLFLKEVSPLRSLFFCSPNITQPWPQVFSVNGSIICSGLHFWRHFDVIGSAGYTLGVIGLIIGKQQLVMVNYVCGFNQSEMGKYFEWIIITFNVGYENYAMHQDDLHSQGDHGYCF